jgi:hypothetical protein
VTGIYTNSGPPIVLERGDETTYISIVEHYKIINPNLPYEDRFRTLFHTLRISTDDRNLLTVRVDREDVLEMALIFLSASQNMPWPAPLSKSSEPSSKPV